MATGCSARVSSHFRAGADAKVAARGQAIVLRDQFAQDSPAVRAFFEALVELLTGGGRKL